MSEADAILDGGEPLGSPMDAASHELPQDWEFAERILKRLNPRNQQDVYDMAARDSKNGGMLITLMVVVWWLFIATTATMCRSVCRSFSVSTLSRLPWR